MVLTFKKSKNWDVVDFIQSVITGGEWVCTIIRVILLTETFLKINKQVNSFTKLRNIQNKLIIY